MFISQAGVDEGVEGRQSISKTTSLLSNLHAEREARDKYKSKTTELYVSATVLVAAIASPGSKKML
jgi:hypothetical protein